MLAIIKREISSYFSSATGYLFLALFYLVAGIIFVGTTLTYKDPRLTFVYATIFIFVCLLIPILTMRLISEDKKQKTDQRAVENTKFSTFSTVIPVEKWVNRFIIPFVNSSQLM